MHRREVESLGNEREWKESDNRHFLRLQPSVFCQQSKYQHDLHGKHRTVECRVTVWADKCHWSLNLRFSPTIICWSYSRRLAANFRSRRCCDAWPIMQCSRNHPSCAKFWCHIHSCVQRLVLGIRLKLVEIKLRHFVKMQWRPWIQSNAHVVHDSNERAETLEN